MKITMLPVISQLLKLRLQRRKEALQKFTVFRTVRRNVPAENPSIFSVNTCNNFRRCTGSPLCKKMRNFQVFYSVFTADGSPARQCRKIKGILSLCHCNAHKLNRRTLPAHFRVKRRRKDRCQQHIDAVTPSRLPDKPFHYRPMSLA